MNIFSQILLNLKPTWLKFDFKLNMTLLKFLYLVLRGESVAWCEGFSGNGRLKSALQLCSIVEYIPTLEPWDVQWRCSLWDPALVSGYRQVIKPAGRPCAARAFDDLRRYQTRTSQFNLAPKMHILGKSIEGDPNINAKLFLLIRNI